MRYSRQREMILKKVSQLNDHPTAEEIHQVASKEIPGLSLGTVYRNLNSLTEAGMVRRVSVPGQADRFDHTLRMHSHLYCTCCGSVTDVPLNEEALLALLQDGMGEVENYSLTVFGRCTDCRAQAGM